MPPVAHADDFGGLPSRLRIVDQTLILNGYGERERWWTDVYRCALYLPAPSSNVAAIMAPSMPKALWIRVLTGMLPDRMPAAWRTLFREELSRELFGRLETTYAELGDNDVLLFSYQPALGTSVYVNGRALLTDPGHGLMETLLDQWLGNRPVSKNLRRLLLNARR